jgi:hypothetical protein
MKEIELSLPEWSIAKQHRRFVMSHSARFSAGKQNRTDCHPFVTGTRKADRSTPSFKMRARKPPRPRRKSCVPAAIARFIQ